MAGIDSLVTGGAKSLLKDKASELMSPAQMEFARFALNPQLYLAEKGISAVADLMGYGSQLKELQQGAQGEKEYYKETMRDALGNVLPGAIGDFVRANKQGIDAPVGAYTTWNPETQSYEEQQSNSPVNVADAFANQRFDAGFNTNSPYNINSDFYVGAQTPQSLPSQVNQMELLEMLSQYAQPDSSPTGLQNFLENNMGSDDYGNPMLAPGGDFAPRNETPMDSGISGGKLTNDYFQDQYKRGGQIRRGGR